MPRSAPLVLQSEAAECGLACAAMIANHHGNGVDISSLRRTFATSLDGISMRSLVAVMDHLCFSTRPVRFEIEYLPSLSTPCILHWEMNHYVVLVRVGAKTVTINDPASGVRTLTRAALSESATGVALECEPRADFVQTRPPPDLRLSELWRPHRGFALSSTAILSLVALGEALGLVVPFVTQLAIDRAIPNGDVETLASLVLVLIGLLVVSAVLQLWRGLMAARVASTVSLGIERSVFRHLLSLPTSFLERRSLGDVINRLESVRPIQAFVTNDAIHLAVDASVLMISLVIILAYEPRLALVPIGFVALSALVRAASTRLVGARTSEVMRAQSREQSLLIETLRSHRAIKLFGREIERLLVWQNALTAHLRASLGLAKFGIALSTGFAVLQGMENALLLLFGGMAVASQQITLGMLVAFLAYANTFSSRAVSALEQLQNYKVLRLHRSRLADIVKHPGETASPSHYAHRRSVELIELEDVSFRYSHFARPLVQRLRFEVRAGCFMLITGPSGGGKSTLFKLLTAVLHPNEGRLLVNGMPVSSYGLADYRKSIGVVMQDDTLLSGSILENVSFFDERMDFERIVEVCTLVGLSHEIDAMPMGYRTLIGDMGSILSGGQKQRLLIARALYHDPDVVFLDEGTANLDAENEARILCGLRDAGKTVVLVSHSSIGRQFSSERWEVRDGEVDRVEGEHRVPVLAV